MDEWMKASTLRLQFNNNQLTVTTCMYFSVAPNSASEDGNIIDWIIKLEARQRPLSGSKTQATEQKSSKYANPTILCMEK